MESGFSWKIPAGMQVSQIQPVGLGVLEDNSSGWVAKHKGRGFFHASADFFRWTLRMLMENEGVLKSAKIYDGVWAFKDQI